EAGTPCQGGCDVGHTDLADRIHFDLAVIHAIAPAGPDVGPGPYANTARDDASSHSFPKLPGEDHAAVYAGSHNGGKPAERKQRKINRSPAASLPASWSCRREATRSSPPTWH